ncbi:MAG: hypothetical protein LIO95_06310 [Clostridiales bacterium]|nr:hypothetical protein [Clostridiales bacterium]
MTAKERGFWNGVRWIFLNMFMPLLPMAIRVAIVFFSNSKAAALQIVELPELIYYTIFMCVICFSMFQERDTSTEKLFGYILGAVVLINLVFIFLYYYGDLKSIVFGITVVMTIFTSLFTLVYKFRVYEGEV